MDENPLANMPFFRADLAAPRGTPGANNKLSDIANGSYSTHLDLTTLVAPEGRRMLKPFFLHDASVPNLETLLDRSREPIAPHPFSISDGAGRSDVIQFLKSLDTQAQTHVARISGKAPLRGKEGLN